MSVEKKVTRSAKLSPPKGNTPHHGKCRDGESLQTAHWLQQLEAKMEKQKQGMIEQLSGSIKSTEERLMQRFNEISAEMQSIKTTVKFLEVRLTAVESTCEAIASLKAEVLALKRESARYENETVATDLIINGIPKARRRFQASVVGYPSNRGNRRSSCHTGK
ncbi:PREDICTED: uncharacterized protein LOC108358081 [Rhagoletis zephyria]|uniref:uncharacterized protein LOC108358081 n=1 Tax=Rhagoletis zephyria TaxID=28612 RepID=UPI00081121AA|nr:PREDICTED: uncharacterized protein LOC108358081 [Rhagoletis zephyria]